MKKIFKIEVDCAVCAGKIESAVKKINGVQDASVSFISQKLALEADENELPRIVKEIKAVGKKIEPDFALGE